VTVRGTLGLLGVFAALAAYLLLVPPPAARLAPLVEPLLAVPAEQVDAIEVTWPERRLRATRLGGTWRSADGAVLPPGTIEDLLAALASLRPTETLAAPDGTVDYGLATGTTLVVSAEGVPVAQLRIGDRNPAWTGVYVRRTGSDDVVLVGALLHWELEKLRAAASR
jgi:uncharacterized protein DUF4340